MKLRKNGHLSFIQKALCLLICLSFFAASACNSACPRQDFDCQVYLQKDQKSPYRDLRAPYTGWHFAGYVSAPGCWSEDIKACVICNDSDALREIGCQTEFKGYTAKPGHGKKIQD